MQTVLMQTIQDTVYSELRQTYRIQPATYRCYPLPKPAPITGIAYYRRLRGMTQKEFALRMNMPSCNLSSTASGNRGLTAANYLKAADILETTVDALLQTYTTLPELDTAHSSFICAFCRRRANLYSFSSSFSFSISCSLFLMR